MEKSVFMVTEFYTPYKHNGLTESNRVHLFTAQHRAIEFIRGTDGNGRLLDHNNRVAIWLKDGCKPQYELGTDPCNITFNVKEECLADAPIKQGGYVYKVTLEEIEVQ